MREREGSERRTQDVYKYGGYRAGEHKATMRSFKPTSDQFLEEGERYE
jgi:hypothetical protein